MKQLIKKTNIIWFLVIAVAFLIGCEDDDDANVPQLVASFAQTISQDTGIVSFINLSENADSYAWDFGDGTTSTEINPIKTYPTGNYTVVLTAKNVAGAEGAFEDELFINIPLPVTFPINFDTDNVDYQAGIFGGTSFQVVENPDLSGANTSASNVGAITNSGVEFEGIFFELGEPLNLSEQKSIKAIFWSDTPIDVLLKLEEGTRFIETTASHGGTGWEEMYFTYDSSDTFSKLTIFVDGPGTTVGTFYIDDISQVDTADIPCTETLLEIPIDFDCNGIDYATKIVGNVSFTVVDNPELSSINSEPTMVGQITNAGANFENAFFNLDTAIDFSMDKGVKMKIFSNQALPILLKFEDDTEAPVESAQNHGGTGWEELTFTLNASGSYNDMVIFVDGPGNAAGTFYVDDIEQVSAMVPDPCTPETSQSLNASDFDLTFQTDPTASIGSFDAGLSWVDNPDFDNEVNKSCKVGQIDRSGAALFANNQIDFDAKFDFNANAGFKLKVWSPNAGTNVLVKLEDKANAAVNVEVGTVTSVASGWEELTFNFASGESGKYDKIILFFELNSNTTETYYIDDFRLFSSGGNSGGGGCDTTLVAATSLPLGFEGCETFLSSANFGQGLTSELVANPFQTGINTSDFVLKVDKPTGSEFFAGVQNTFNNFDLTTTMNFKAKVYSTKANVVMRFELAVIPNDGSIGNPAPVFVTIANANEWTEVEFTFINLPASPTTYNHLVIKPDNDQTDSAITSDGTYYFDDIRLE